MHRCTACILPETYPGIEFDPDGVCNHCRAHRHKRPRGREALTRITDAASRARKAADNAQYDCIVSLSGGRDSSFAAHYAVRVLGLRALLFTYDNGLMPEQTLENIRNTAAVLGADQVIIKGDQVKRSAGYLLNCWLYHPSPAMIGLLCSGCMSGLKWGLAQTVRQYKIPLVLTGSGEPKSRSSFAQELLGPVQTKDKKKALVQGFAQEVLANPRYLYNPAFVGGLARDFFYRFVYRGKKRARSISIFGFIEWNETELLATIENELGWIKPTYSRSSWRADCFVNELKNYLYQRMLGFTKHDEQLSGMIREGMLTRQEAEARLERDNVISEPFIKELCQTLGVDWQKLHNALPT